MDRIRKLPEFKAILNRVDGDGGVWVHGLWGSSKAYLVASINYATRRPGLVITASPQQAERFYEDLLTFSEEEVFLFPDWEVLPHEKVRPHEDIMAQRLAVMARLLQPGKQCCIVVAPIQAMMRKAPSPQFLASATISLSVGQRMDLKRVLKMLMEYKYERVQMVENKGEFGLRGGILDVYPITNDDPLRIELTGDEVASIRSFHPVTQRSISRLDEAKILPADEVELLRRSDKLATLLGYLTPQTTIFLDEPLQIRERCSDLGDVIEPAPQRPLVYISFLFQGLPEIGPVDNILLKADSMEAIYGKPGGWLAKIGWWQANGYDIIFFCNAEGELERLREYLTQNGMTKIEDLSLKIGQVQCGFSLPEIKLCICTDQEFFGRYKLRRPRRKFSRGAAISTFLDLEPGDYCVHINHGIGRYLGLERSRVDGQMRDFLAIEYKDGDKLYVPTCQVDLVQKYVGLERIRPKLHKLGGGLWSRVKRRVGEAIRDMASELLEMQAIRETKPGFAFSADDPWQKEFEDAFIYEPTPDQGRAVREVKSDMESSRPMDRLTCGDVGYGKTEVAIRAAFKAVMDNKQVAVLVPTTVLAQQHLSTFRERLADYPIIVEMLSRFKTPKEQQEILCGLSDGRVDVVVGTHRLIQPDVKFHDLGLVIIDEEQRFGVAHKERLKKLRALVDVLTLTATPIPRTLYMSLTGIRDMSSINTPPQDRLSIRTVASEFDEGLIVDAIRRELARDGQVYFVYPRVADIERGMARIHRLVPEARVGQAHGQMQNKELEEVMIQFTSGRIQVLVCTNIIESGLDIPNVNTIVINEAHRFGLADLYQLRGRVGRFKHRAYAYLLIPRGVLLSSEAQRRVKAIEEFSELGSGFKIAMRDLEIRGAGNLLGLQQHGYIVQVGFDLYCRLLEAAIRELKGEPPEEPKAILDLGLDGYLPDDYISDPKARIAIYRKFVSITDSHGFSDLAQELCDRFGKLPWPVGLLFRAAKLRMLAGQSGIRYIGKQDDRLVLEGPSDKKAYPLNMGWSSEELLSSIEGILRQEAGSRVEGKVSR